MLVTVEPGLKTGKRIPTIVCPARGQAESHRACSSDDSFEHVNRFHAQVPRSWLRLQQITRDNRLRSAANNSGPPKAGRRTRLYWPGLPRKKSRVVRYRPHPRVRTRLNILSLPKQSPGACPLATCPGHWATRRIAPIQTPRWPSPAIPQANAPKKLLFTFQEWLTPVPSWFGCGRLVLVA